MLFAFYFIPFASEKRDCMFLTGSIVLTRLLRSQNDVSADMQELTDGSDTGGTKLRGALVQASSTSRETVSIYDR